jgi:hypothetical protein
MKWPPQAKTKCNCARTQDVYHFEIMTRFIHLIDHNHAHIAVGENASFSILYFHFRSAKRLSSDMLTTTVLNVQSKGG